MKEIEFIRQIAAVMSGLGYKVTVAPSSVPNKRKWPFDPRSWTRAAKYRPDLLVEDGEDYALVEAKTRPFLFGGVIQARNYAGYFGATVIVYVPDEIVEDIPSSVLRFAGEEDIQVCPFSKLPGALKDQFGARLPHALSDV